MIDYKTKRCGLVVDKEPTAIDGKPTTPAKGVRMNDEGCLVKDEWIPEKGEMILISNFDDGPWSEREFIAYDNRLYSSWITIDQDKGAAATYPHAKPLEPGEEEIKLYDVVSVSDSMPMIVLRIDGAWIDGFSPDRGEYFRSMIKGEAVVIPNKIALAPALIKTFEGNYRIETRLHSNEDDAEETWEASFIRWPSRPIDFVIVDKEER
jgi:hypothetical protein